MSEACYLYLPIDRSNDLQGSLADPHIQLHVAAPIKRSASTPTLTRPRQSEPRFIGLQDRLAKEALAVPISVRRLDFDIPTDQTMATRGSGSSAPHYGHHPLEGVNKEDQSAHLGRDADSHASMFVHLGDQEKRGPWAKIKRRTKQLFRRSTKVNIY